MKKSGSILSLVMLMMLAMACSKTPHGVIKPDDMSRLLADVYRGESVIEFNNAQYSNDSMKKVVKQSVLEAHGVTEADFDSSLVWYGHHIEDYLKVCDRAIEMLESELASMPDDENGLNLMLVAGDSASVWPRSRYYHITPETPSRYITFKLLPDDNWEPGDNYSLEFKLINMRTPVKSALAVDYSDGRTSWVNNTRNEEGWAKVKLTLDSTRTASAVYGFMEFDPAAGEHIYVDSISLIRTRKQPGRMYVRYNNSSFDYGRTNE